MPPPDGGSQPTPVASPQQLVALDADDWARLLRHIRASLAGREAATLTPEGRRLQSVPASRLAGGSARRRLAILIASDPVLWADIANRAATTDADVIERLADPAPSPERGPPVTPELKSSVKPDARPDAKPDVKAKARAKQLRAERDEARRRADGERVRADRLALEVGRLEGALAAAQASLVEREEDLARALADATQQVARAARRDTAELEQLRDVVAEHRRTDEERRLRDERRRRGRETAARDAAAEVASHKAEQRQRRGGAAPGNAVRPGRPTALPSHLVSETGAHARALLGRGRLVIVDGYNVTKTQRPDLQLEHQRRWLIALLETAATRTGIDPMVFFDAGPGAGGITTGATSRSVRVRFTSPELSADDEIVFEVAALQWDEPVVVVTDDRELRDRLASYQVDLVRTLPFVQAAGG